MTTNGNMRNTSDITTHVFYSSRTVLDARIIATFIEAGDDSLKRSLSVTVNGSIICGDFLRDAKMKEISILFGSVPY